LSNDQFRMIARLCRSRAAVWLAVPVAPSHRAVMARHDLEDRLVNFACTACRLGERLPRTPLGQHAALQLARSSTSTLANYGEVQSAESRRDFIHKLVVCLKELHETR